MKLRIVKLPRGVLQYAVQEEVPSGYDVRDREQFFRWVTRDTFADIESAERYAETLLEQNRGPVAVKAYGR